MKSNIMEFIRRGMIACGFGPIILAIIYLVLQHKGAVETLTVNQVCLGIFSLSALAFIAGGMNILYQIEQLPLLVAILIHGSVLYVSYLVTYLVNGWLKLGITPIIAFSSIFFLGYILIWVLIYTSTRRNTENLNRILNEKQQIKINQ